MKRQLLLGLVILVVSGWGCQKDQPEEKPDCSARAAEFHEWGQKLLAGEVERPKSSIDSEIDKMMKMGNIVEEPFRLGTLLFLAFRDCHYRVLDNLKPLETANGEDKPRLVIEGITKTLSDCNCTADLDNAKAVAYAWLHK